MTILPRLRALFQPRDTFPAALALTPLHEDHPDTRTEAEHWLEVCWEQCGTPLVQDPASRAILERAAKWHATTGYNGLLCGFNDESKLLVNQVMEAVL